MSDSPIRAILGAIDALDLDAAISLFASGATLKMAFGEEAAGLEQVRAELGAFIGELRTTGHELTAEWNPEPGLWIAEMTATYELNDFSRRGPYLRAIFIQAGDGGIDQMRVYGAHEEPLRDGGRTYGNVRGPHGWLPTL